MGANAQTSVPAFVAGQVLTAQQQTEINTGVPVFATTVTRDAAFGGTGEKVLAEGQLAYIEASNIVQYYDGSTWATLAPSATGAVTFISATTIGSGVSTVTVSNCFSATYENYYVIINGGVASANTILQLQMGTTTTGYYFAQRGLTYGGVAGDNWGSNATEWAIGLGSTNTLDGFLTITNPNTAKNTQFTSQASQAATNGSAFASAGYLADTTAYTGFKLLCSGGATLTGGTIRVYGISNS